MTTETGKAIPGSARLKRLASRRRHGRASQDNPHKGNVGEADKRNHQQEHDPPGTPDKNIAPVVQAEASAVTRLKVMMEEKEGSVLRAWLRHFDSDNDRRVRKHEFCLGVSTLGYRGNVTSFFQELDADKSGEITLEEIDDLASFLWPRFSAWAASSFAGAAQMLEKLAGKNVNVSKSKFISAVQLFGWRHGYEEYLFNALSHNLDHLTMQDLQWVDLDVKRALRKTQARERADPDRLKKKTNKEQAQRATREFRNFLLQKYGTYLLAWRVALSPNDSMAVHKTQFMKSCAKLGWYSASRQIWQTLAAEENGSMGLHELDLKSAELLASFRRFAQVKFGSAAGAFRAIDKKNTKQVRMPDFVSALHVLGFHRSVKSLFHGLDRSGRKSLTEEDLLFIDEWNPQPFLLAVANPDAAKEVKAVLFHRYGTYLRAWRRLLDKDNTNRCSWPQFQAACVSLHYTGDTAGAWRHLDEDLSGYITFQEFDETAARVLLEFKAWATEEFGSLASAFQVFDEDGSKEVTKQEFCSACRVYNFIGKPTPLFRTFDVDGEGSVTLDEVCFLDGWQIDEGEEETTEPEQQQLQQPQQRPQQDPPKTQRAQTLQQLKQPTPPSIAAISEVMRFLPRPSLDGDCSNRRKSTSIQSRKPAPLRLSLPPLSFDAQGPSEPDLNMSSDCYGLPGKGHVTSAR